MNKKIDIIINNTLCVLTTFFVLTVILCMFSLSASANVKCSMKGTTYTVSGIGKMTEKDIPSKKQKKKIKKVVIKKGVTSIPRSAFEDCKKLRDIKIADTVKSIDCFAFYNTEINELTIPNSVKKLGYCIVGGKHTPAVINMPGKIKYLWQVDDEGYSAHIVGRSENSPSMTINFTTDLDLKTLAYMPADSFNVLESDKNYASFDGLIYTKKMDKLLRVPGRRNNIVVKDGCTVIDLLAFNYKCPAVEDYVDAVEMLDALIIPESVTTIDDSALDEYDYSKSSGVMSNVKLTIKGHNLDNDSAMKLYKTYSYSKGVIRGLADSGYLTLNNDFLLLNDDELPDANGHFAYKYIGDDKNITIPDCAYEVGEYLCFEDSDVESVTMSDSVKVIGDQAFYSYKKLKEVKLNEGLEKIGIQAFSDTGLTSLTIPSTVKTLETCFIEYTGIRDIEVPADVTSFDSAFASSNIYSITFHNTFDKLPGSAFAMCPNLCEVKLPDTVKVIGDNAFEDCFNIDIQEVLNSLPNLTRIEKRAFYMVPFKDIVIPESVSYIGGYAFHFAGSYKKVINDETKKKINYEKISKTVQFNNKNIKLAKNAVDVYNNVTFVYSGKFAKAATIVEMAGEEKYLKSKKAYRIKYRWARVKGAAGYQVLICSNKKMTKQLYQNEVKGNSVTVEIPENDIDFYLYVKVRPYQKSGSKKVYGKWSPVLHSYVY